MRALRDAYQEFGQRGASAAAVTQGTAAQTASLCQRHNVPFRCLADPSRQAYAAFGLERGSMAQVMGPDVLLKQALSAFRGNFGPPGGDVFQLAGTFVIGTDGTVRLAYRSRDATDIPPMDTVFSAI